MKKQEVVIKVEGGQIEEVYSTANNLNVKVIDLDLLDFSDDEKEKSGIKRMDKKLKADLKAGILRRIT